MVAKAQAANGFIPTLIPLLRSNQQHTRCTLLLLAKILPSCIHAHHNQAPPPEACILWLTLRMGVGMRKGDLITQVTWKHNVAARQGLNQEVHLSLGAVLLVRPALSQACSRLGTAERTVMSWTAS